MRTERVIANFRAWLPLFEHLPGGGSEHRDGVTRWWSDTPLPMFNGLWGAPRTDAVETALDDLLAAAEGRPLIWVVPPPDDLDDALRRRGFEVERLPAMALSLASLPERPTPPGVAVREVDDDPGLLAVATTISFTASGFPATAAEPILAMLERIPGRDRYRTFLATVDREPAAASVLLAAAGVAGVYNVATLPGHRRRGLGTLVSLAALAAGRERGCDLGALEATADGEPLYRGLGFEECCRITVATRP